nr:hypothetical protein MarFTME_382 [Marseillevirus futianmevirus]
MDGIWYSSTDSVLVSSEKYLNDKGEYVEPPQLPVFSVMSQSDFYKTYGPEKDWDAFLAAEKDKFAQEQENYKREMASLTLERKELGRYITPIICPRSDIVSSEPRGRKFFVPETLFRMCGSLASMQDYEREAEEHNEGESDDDGECVRLPFHYLYCRTAVDFLVWKSQNEGVEDEESAKQLRKILNENYESISKEEKEEIEKQRKDILSFQRENCEKADSFGMTDRFHLLFYISDFLDNKDLHNASGICNAETVVGFTPKDFRIQLDKPDRPMEDKLATYKELSWLNEKDLEIN